METSIINSVIQNSFKSMSALSETTSADIALQPEFLEKLIHFSFRESSLPIISSIINLKRPSGLIYSSTPYYNGQSATAKFENTKVFKLSGLSDFNVNDQVIGANSGAIGTVLYSETNKILVEVTSGTFQTNELFQGSTLSISAIYSGRLANKKLFNSYSGPYFTAQGENIVPREVSIKTKSKNITTSTRKIKTNITREAIQDYEAVYGEDAKEVIAKVIAKEINIEVEKEIFDYMRMNSTDKPDIIVTDRQGSTDLIYAYTYIYTQLLKETAQMTRRINKNATNYIIASPEIIAALLASGALNLAHSGSTGAQYVQKASNYVGKALGTIDVIQSDFTEENEIILGYHGGDFTGDSSLIFAPYSLNTYYATDPKTGIEHLFVAYRYGYCLNPFDEGSGIGDSDFLSRFYVDFSDVQQY